MNEAIARNAIRLSGLFLALFVLMTAGTFYWGFVRADEMAVRPDNLRRISFDRRIERGSILDRRGRTLAESLPIEAQALDARSAGALARQYPYPAAAPVIGFQTWDYGAGGDARVTYGVGGAEAAYDPALRGDLGMSIRQLLASRLLHRPQAGHDIQLALDAELQDFAASQIGDREGAVVVLDIESGALRSLVSLPTFDPRSLDQSAPSPDDPSRPLLNRATQGLYSPGSTWKDSYAGRRLGRRFGRTRHRIRRWKGRRR